MNTVQLTAADPAACGVGTKTEYGSKNISCEHLTHGFSLSLSFSLRANPSDSGFRTSPLIRYFLYQKSNYKSNLNCLPFPDLFCLSSFRFDSSNDHKFFADLVILLNFTLFFNGQMNFDHQPHRFLVRKAKSQRDVRELQHLL